jgi:hypothetical protein
MTSRSVLTTPKIFVSHSAQDAEVAGQLVALIRLAFNLPAQDIRCTSVDGSRLPGGAYTDGQLRKEILSADVLIGLISKSAIGSAYVMFELGARWGIAKPLIPVLAPGSDSSLLAGPPRRYQCSSRW